MAEHRMPKPETRVDNNGTVPSRDPDASGDPRAHHEFGMGNSVHHTPDPRGLREYDPSLPGIDRQDSRRHSDATRRDDDRARVRDDVRGHLDQHHGHMRGR